MPIRRTPPAAQANGVELPRGNGPGHDRVVDLTVLDEDAPRDGVSPSDESVLRLAVELLVAQRAGDQRAFLVAMNQAGGRTSDLLVSMAAVANRSLDAAVGPDSAARLVERQRSDLPRPERAPGAAADTTDTAWRDAVAMAEAVADGRSDDALLLMINTADQTLLFRCFVQMVALLTPSIPPQALLDVVDRVRGELPPPL